MGRQDYITLITKALKVTDKIKYRILADIETEIECLLEKGLIMSEIISIKGTPVDVAKSFNDSYFGTAVAIQYNKQKLFNNIAICSIVASICLFIISAVTGFVNFDSVIDGGCSGPTIILESANYVLISILSIVSLVLGLIALFISVVFLLKYYRARSRI